MKDQSHQNTHTPTSSSTAPLTPASRTEGAILGVCVADALGGPVQFSKPGDFKPITDLRFVKPFGRPAGSWSDDGSMMLCLAQSFIDSNRQYDGKDVASKFHQWCSNGYMSSDGQHAWDVGMGTSIACKMWARVFEEGDVDFDAMQKLVKEAPLLTREMSQGNGSLMRVAPVGVVFHDSPSTAVKVAKLQSDLTHPMPACAEACAIYTELVCMCFEAGMSKDAMAQRLADMTVADEKLRTRLENRQGHRGESRLMAWKSFSIKNVKSTGWVVDTLDCALWAFFTTDTWEQGALKVVNLGGDSDTAGAVYGGLAGAWYGVNAIPERWRSTIARADMVEDVARKLAALNT